MSQSIYKYKAIVKRIIDADTIVVDIDLGFKTIIQDLHLRLANINAPETRGSERPKGLQAKKLLESLLPPNSEILIETQKEPGKYGRYIAIITIPNTNIKNVSEYLIDNGYAKQYDGSGPVPRFPIDEKYPL